MGSRPRIKPSSISRAPPLRLVFHKCGPKKKENVDRFSKWLTYRFLTNVSLGPFSALMLDLRLFLFATANISQARDLKFFTFPLSDSSKIRVYCADLRFDSKAKMPSSRSSRAVVRGPYRVEALGCHVTCHNGNLQKGSNSSAKNVEVKG